MSVCVCVWGGGDLFQLSLKGLGRYANIGPLLKLSHPTFSVFYRKQNVEQAPLCFPAQIEITLQTGADCDSGEMKYLIFTVLVVSHICSD